MKQHYLKITLNFLAVVLLISLIATPLYFARNFAKVAGVKSFSKFLVVSQVEKFPNIKFAQEGDKYTISFTKQGPTQAFLGILIINNPTSQSQTYAIRVISGQSNLFFGEDLDNQVFQITLPASTSSAVSLVSEGSSTNQIVKFQITAAGE